MSEKKQTTEKQENSYSPYVISPNSSVARFRVQKEKKEEKERFPLGKFPFRSVINFGSRTDNCYEKVALVTKDGSGVVLNHPDNIKNASNKVTCKKILMNHKLPTPAFILPGKFDFDAQKFPLKFPVVGKLIKGSGGKGMVVMKNLEEVKKFLKDYKDTLQEYFIEEVFQADMKKSYEFRIAASPLLYMKHIVQTGGSKTGLIIAMRKLMRQDAVNSGEFGRNIALGNSYFTQDASKFLDAAIMLKAYILATEACMACDLDFGAVDMIYSSELKTWTILEINTAPSMGDEEAHVTADRWKQLLPVMLLEKKKLQ